MPATYEPIATTTLGSSATSFTFSTIPGTYTDLVLVCNSLYVTGTGNASIQFNGDTGTNYSRTTLIGNGTTASSGRSTSSSLIVGWHMAASQPTLGIVHIFNYAGSTNKSVLIDGSSDTNGSGEVRRIVGLWRNTAAITSITVSASTFNTGTTATLYGILKA